MSDDRLIPREATVSKEAVSGRLFILMMNIESSFKLAGANPGEDYSYTDLMDYAIQLYTSSEDLEIPGLEHPE